MLPQEFLKNLQKEQTKGFLHYLCAVKDTNKKRERVRRKRILNAATNEELDTLVDVLHFLALGLIPIKGPFTKYVTLRGCDLIYNVRGVSVMVLRI